jgi:hypothetical protein
MSRIKIGLYNLILMHQHDVKLEFVKYAWQQFGLMSFLGLAFFFFFSNKFIYLGLDLKDERVYCYLYFIPMNVAIVIG